MSQFRQYVLEAAWDRAEACLIGLGVTDEDSLWVCRHSLSYVPRMLLLALRRHLLCLISLLGMADVILFGQDARVLIAQQKYLEYLEAQRTQEALQVLRNELAHMSIDTEHLHTLSRCVWPFQGLFPVDQLRYSC